MYIALHGVALTIVTNNCHQLSPPSPPRARAAPAPPPRTTCCCGSKIIVFQKSTHRSPKFSTQLLFLQHRRSSFTKFTKFSNLTLSALVFCVHSCAGRRIGLRSNTIRDVVAFKATSSRLRPLLLGDCVCHNASVAAAFAAVVGSVTDIHAVPRN